MQSRNDSGEFEEQEGAQYGWRRMIKKKREVGRLGG